MKKFDEVARALDAWVAEHGNGQYISRKVVPLKFFQMTEDLGIQQDRQEILEFVKYLMEHKITGTAMEVGLGYFGSSHFLWRLLFSKRVITVERSLERVRGFVGDYRSRYGSGALEKSSFILGSSHEPRTVRKAYTFQNIDMLFIDGDHNYDAVLADWLLYSPLVRKGGIVAFHDTAWSSEEFGVPAVVRKLREGKIDGKKYPMKDIIHTKFVGISFYKVS